MIQLALLSLFVATVAGQGRTTGLQAFNPHQLRHNVRSLYLLMDNPTGADFTCARWNFGTGIAHQKSKNKPGWEMQCYASHYCGSTFGLFNHVYCKDWYPSTFYDDYTAWSVLPAHKAKSEKLLVYMDNRLGNRWAFGLNNCISTVLFPVFGNDKNNPGKDLFYAVQLTPTFVEQVAKHSSVKPSYNSGRRCASSSDVLLEVDMTCAISYVHASPYFLSKPISSCFKFQPSSVLPSRSGVNYLTYETKDFAKILSDEYGVELQYTDLVTEIPDSEIVTFLGSKVLKEVPFVGGLLAAGFTKVYKHFADPKKVKEVLMSEFKVDVDESALKAALAELSQLGLLREP
ncbi:hypothetical protein K493DRAFT_357257 [Basidiobolus meristosporus CBS 931.73]|uniref:Uncharacterized protein n=1 Tax=Basidiobolus meristosporus CBS 931.73 TaxID=1314790 RepID=A0A1Y1XWI4_9FUNG|nr:hypothetical protein K493DRAFT_357257 [Basidiobolus meristosporus CBS 931.73]|eukprot:ORX90127.1 hypothetical protein K493DRAFT_357257 [Basidiobolus meristosporus CBS 931.73]